MTGGREVIALRKYGELTTELNRERQSNAKLNVAFQGAETCSQGVLQRRQEILSEAEKQGSDAGLPKAVEGNSLASSFTIKKRKE